MPSCTSYAVAAPGACSRMISPSGRPSIGTFDEGLAKGSGITSCTPFASRCGSSKAAILSPALPSSIASPSKPVRCAALRKASMAEKNLGRKRHLLVDTQGWLLAVKVLAANRSDLEGAKQMLAPLNSLFPRLRHVWGDSHYGASGEREIGRAHV